MTFPGQEKPYVDALYGVILVMLNSKEFQTLRNRKQQIYGIIISLGHTKLTDIAHSHFRTCATSPKRRKDKYYSQYK